MRIISGLRRGFQLKTPEGLHTRPTTDRVKESLFNIIQFHLPCDAVLDLFSGSGALGIECLSRRCTHCTFVDNDPASYSVIQENLQNARLLASAALYRQNVQDFLSRCDQRFDLILMDPPYNRGHILPALTLIHQRDLLKKGGLIVAESEKNGETVDDTYYTVRRTAAYGNTVLTILQG